MSQFGNQLKEFIKKEYSLSASINHENTELAISLANANLTDELCSRLGRMKQDITTFPLYLACRGFPNNPNLQTCYSIRPNEQIFIQTFTDKILVTVSVVFEEPSDEVLAKVIHQVLLLLFSFVQEFETVKRQHAFQLAPSISVSKTSPFEDTRESPSISSCDVVKKPKLYITFGKNRYFAYGCLGLFQRTILEEYAKAIDAIVSFRNFLHYHIKCTKAFIHSRMNVKTSQFLQTLNFPETE